MKQTLDIGRRQARRWAAMAGFGFLILCGVLVVTALLYHPARKDIAEALTTATVVVISFITPVTAIVGAYLGVSLKEKLVSMKNGDP